MTEKELKELEKFAKKKKMATIIILKDICLSVVIDRNSEYE